MARQSAHLIPLYLLLSGQDIRQLGTFFPPQAILLTSQLTMLALMACTAVDRLVSVLFPFV